MLIINPLYYTFPVLRKYLRSFGNVCEVYFCETVFYYLIRILQVTATKNTSNK